MSNHSPSPWSVNSGRQDIYTIGDFDGRTVVDVENIDEQARADALLIAAAPELLEALKYAVELVQDCACVHERMTGYPYDGSCEDCPNSCVAKNWVRIILKAEGGEQ